ncbi:hypothetical protein Bbelb_013620 [Branchiostoma belcheri]|nr:hypothetical protein Bbelb_013620 [Branchiostoma belcheri]
MRHESAHIATLRVSAVCLGSYTPQAVVCVPSGRILQAAKSPVVSPHDHGPHQDKGGTRLVACPVTSEISQDQDEMHSFNGCERAADYLTPTLACLNSTGSYRSVHARRPGDDSSSQTAHALNQFGSCLFADAASYVVTSGSRPPDRNRRPLATSIDNVGTDNSSSPELRREAVNQSAYR